jgi:hypothetical protein
VPADDAPGEQYGDGRPAHPQRGFDVSQQSPIIQSFDMIGP